ncbi:MAG: hypothetical protein QM278_02955 [Pseudomonadota bacterium]|nr:hypothetical protein [Pseudomonadota bacterium]
MLQEEGFLVEAAAFNRKYHKGRLPSCDLIQLGIIENGKYFIRLLKILKAIPNVRTAIARNDVVYASGQDMAFLGFLAGFLLGKPIVMEVGDLVNIQVASSIKSKIFRIIDRWITSRYALIVTISEGFLNIYYRKWLKIKTRGIVIQNKLEKHLLKSLTISVSDSKKKDKLRPILDRPLIIGYFGLLRDLWSLQVLIKLAELYPGQYEIVLAGMPMKQSNFAEQSACHPNVKYIGEYRSPEDLPFLYGQVDMIWACYPEIKRNDWNLRWGRPNRFYESCFFKKPCFAREGSLFAEDVKRYNIGCLIRDVDVEKVVMQISSINYNEFKEWHEALLKLPQDVYLYEYEGRDLANEIRKLRPIEKQRLK